VGDAVGWRRVKWKGIIKKKGLTRISGFLRRK